MVTKPDTHQVTTPETLSELAAQADLGTLDQKTALMLKLCEVKAENKASSIISSLQTNLATLQERYKALLRELRDKLQSIKFDDFVKIIIGLLGGFVIRSITQQGLIAFEDKWVVISIFFFIICLVFLIIRYLAPSKRKKELDKELQILNGEKKQ